MSQPTLIKTAACVVRDAEAAVAAMRAILDDARAWGLLGVDLEWDQEEHITWIGFGTARRACAFWRASLPPEALQLARDAMADATLPKLGHNGIQADRPIWERDIGPVRGVWEDTMLLHHAAYPGLAHDLQNVVSQFLVVPPWKSWRAESARRARVAAKEAEKLATQVARAQARAEKQAAQAAAREQAKLQRQAEHEARNAARAAEKAARKAQRQAEHEARNAALAAEKAARKAQRSNGSAP